MGLKLPKKASSKEYISSVFLIFITSLLVIHPVMANKIKVAVASNFTYAMKAVIKPFEQKTKHKIILIFGSTGKHYAQIKNGAPFELFFAADVKHPKRLEEQGIAIAGSRFTYAIGHIYLWGLQSDFVDPEGQILKTDKFHHLAIANPKLAPYGKAAQQVLKSLGLWNKLQKYLVTGENITQAFQFVQSGNAELGFIAYSQLKQSGQSLKNHAWKIPQTLYQPIKQQAVLLKDSPAARAFIVFIQSNEAHKIIRDAGYTTDVN